MHKLVEYSTEEESGDYEPERLHYQLARDIINAVACSYHLLRASGNSESLHKEQEGEDKLEEEVISYHAYKSTTLKWPQVRNVQFQTNVLEI